MAERDISKPKGAAPRRPSRVFPESMREAVKAMARNGQSVEDARAFLVTNGFSIDRKVIARVMIDGPETLADIASGDVARAHNAIGLSSPFFDEEMRNVVDDAIIDGRSPSRIRAWLSMSGLDVEIDELVFYVEQRKEFLEDLADDPVALANERIAQHLRALRARQVHIWSQLPDDQKFTAKTYTDTVKEIGVMLKFQKDSLRQDNAGKGGDAKEHYSEIERKLGLVPLDDAPAPQDSVLQ